MRTRTVLNRALLLHTKYSSIRYTNSHYCLLVRTSLQLSSRTRPSLLLLPFYSILRIFPSLLSPLLFSLHSLDLALLFPPLSPFSPVNSSLLYASIARKDSTGSRFGSFNQAENKELGVCVDIGPDDLSAAC